VARTSDLQICGNDDRLKARDLVEAISQQRPGEDSRRLQPSEERRVRGWAR